MFTEWLPVIIYSNDNSTNKKIQRLGMFFLFYYIFYFHLYRIIKVCKWPIRNGIWNLNFNSNLIPKSKGLCVCECIF